MHSFFDLTGKVALVTGGGGAIGGATVRALARAGADVVVEDLREEAALRVAAEVRDLGRRSLALAGDAADFALAGRLAAQALEAFGRVDILVTVAGGGQPKGIVDLSEAEFDRVVAQNLKSAWNWAKHLAPQMLTRDGQPSSHSTSRIVFISSMSAKYGGGPPASVSRSSYCAAKAGLLGLAHGLAKELAPRVTVNAVLPGLIETPGTASVTQGPHMDRVLGMIPMGRTGRPDDVAAAVLFLASPGAGWITGECMDVNGGQYLD